MEDFDSASALAAAIKRKAVSPVEAARFYLKRADERNPALNALIYRRDEQLLAEAAQAEAALMQKSTGDLPPFFGVPIPIKDLSETKGEPTTMGSYAHRAKVGRYDSTAVDSLRRAGFLFMGRTNSPEFGTLPVTENKLYGATRNPWNTAKTPGGSSGGAGAVVAAGIAPVAHASDGGGSIRIPASCCGLVGLKASRARIPKGPYLSEIMHGFSTDGCVSTGIDDTAAILDALAQLDPSGWYGVPKPAVSFLEQSRGKPEKLRIAVATQGPMSYPTAPACVEAVDRAATMLRSFGHEVFPGTPDWAGSGEQLAADFITVWSSATAYQELSDFSETEPVNRGLRALAEKLSAVDYIKAVSRLQLFSRKVVQSFGQSFDLLLTPTMAMEPPDIGWIFATNTEDPVALLNRSAEMVPLTGWTNVTGQPSISLPTYIAPSGLPVGIQLTAPPLREDMLLRIGRQLEQACAWQKHLPR
jgi:amidase